MRSRLIKAFLLLPGTVLIFVPLILLFSSRNSKYTYIIAETDQLRFWVGLLCFGIGLILAIWTVRLQVNFGEGTPAPWDPPQKLVIEGPYKLMRNPMISGAILILAAESMLLGSWPITWWMIIFLIMNMFYFPYFEEKELEDRFGEDYRIYMKSVPRWIPRIRLWK